jgi:N-acetylglucosaminyl-diphospho-decaprenol L-rhamnosyltransferase
VTPRVSAVLVSWNTRNDLLDALASLDRVRLPLEVIVVDNASSDGTAEAVRLARPNVFLIANAENVGFGRAANQGIRAARAPYVLLLNSDAALQPGALEALVALLDARSDVAVAAPRTRYEDGSIQVSFGKDLTPLNEFVQRRLVKGVARREPRALVQAERAAGVEHEPDWVSGSCWLARREALEAVGLFDEGYFLYEEDADLCLRLRRAGFRIVFTPAAEAVHRQGKSAELSEGRALSEYHRSHVRYYDKHNGLLARAALRLSLKLRGLR